MPKLGDCPEFTAAAVLPALIEAFRERGADRLPTDEIVAALTERLGRPITANRVARTLGLVGVKPRQFRIGGRPRWGYLLADLAERRDADPPVESRDAEAAAPPVPVAVAVPEPSVGVVVQDHLDAEREWSWRLALAMGH